MDSTERICPWCTRRVTGGDYQTDIGDRTWHYSCAEQKRNGATAYVPADNIPEALAAAMPPAGRG